METKDYWKEENTATDWSGRPLGIKTHCRLQASMQLARSLPEHLFCLPASGLGTQIL